MNSANNLFKKLKSFKIFVDPYNSSQNQLFNYCKNILGAVERLHVDYKQKKDRRNAKLDVDDKKNIAKTVSGFANSGGGVLIWGIQDKSLSPKPISEIQKFLSSILELSVQLTDPVVKDIDGEWLLSDGSSKDGFAIIYIPESMLPPHRVILNQQDVKDNHYIRSGESFVIASHTQLEDLFGRRPKPQLILSIRVIPTYSLPKKDFFVMLLGIENIGRGTARSHYLSIKVNPPYHINKYGVDGNMNFGLLPFKKTVHPESEKYGATSDRVIHPGIVHDVTAIKLEIDKDSQPLEMSDLTIQYQIAAEGIQLIEKNKTIKASRLLNMCQRAKKAS
jgi:hypothetical protein